MGVGAQLLYELEKWAEVSGFDSIVLKSVTRAVQFYEKQGFRKSKTPCQKGEEKEIDLLSKCLVPPPKNLNLQTYLEFVEHIETRSSPLPKTILPKSPLHLRSGRLIIR